MNFVTAMKAMLEGKRIQRNGIIMSVVDSIIYSEPHDDVVDITAELLDATNFEAVAVPIVLDEDQLYAVFNPQKNRWVSTTEPAKHKAAGLEVAVFSFDTAI